MAFDAAGNVSGSAIRFRGISDEAEVFGVGSSASGFVGSDDPRCFASASDRICTVSGSWGAPQFQAPVPVPEPASLALFGLGLAALGVARRRRKAS
jgi:hypothetical protein